MPFDPEISDGLKSQLMAGTNVATLTGQTNNQVASKQLDLVALTVTQAQAGNADDPAVIAALQTAAHSPRQGAAGS